VKDLPTEAHGKLDTARNIWLASVRPDGRPHLAPIWFAWHAGKVYLCTEPASIKARNIQHNARVSLALEDGHSPVICEGTASVVPSPWPPELIAIFKRKYDWDIASDEQYTALIEVTPVRWLNW
jgi:PPOX class probable F420-dependent enzyme